jgi:hypothetical protein
MTTYRLQSSPAICAPGVVRLAQAAYRSGDEAWAVQILSTWKGVPVVVAEALAAGRLPFTVDAEESVVVIVTPSFIEEERKARAFKLEQYRRALGRVRSARLCRGRRSYVAFWLARCAEIRQSIRAF